MRKSVVVTTWRRPAELLRCLEGLSSQSRLPDEVVVVARSTDAETHRALQRAQLTDLPLRLVEVTDPGMAVSLNAGIRAAKGELVAITDDDAVPRGDWLERVELHLQADAGLGGVGGRDWVHQGSKVLDQRATRVGEVRWYGRVIGNHHLGSGGPREVDVLKGVNMAFRREALWGVSIGDGLRGSATQPHWEIGLCLALKRSGWRLLYDPAVAVDHYPAQRHDEDQRGDRSLAALGNDVYNETYVLLRWLSGGRKAASLGYGLLVGTRQAPGVVVALERASRRQSAPGAFAAAQRARLEAARAALVGE